MLSRLTIRNYALIRHLELAPSPRLTVITGETGAGKSIMLGAVNLLLGVRADTKVLWDESAKCVIEGHFQIADYDLAPLFESLDLDYSDQTVIRREISPGGKSRAFINDTPVTLEVMRAIGNRLMDVHSQHETLELGSRQFQLNLIDSYAGNANLLREYREAWADYRESQSAFEKLTAEANKLKTEYDFTRFQLDELKKADFQPGEQEKLESDLKVGEHAEDIKSRLSQVVAFLGDTEGSSLQRIDHAVALLQPIKDLSPALSQLVSRLDGTRIELKDLLREAEHEEEGIEVDPARTKQIQERLDLLFGLLQKHRAPDVNQLVALRAVLEEQVRKTVNLDEGLKAAEDRRNTSQTRLVKKAEELSTSRKKIFTSLCKELVSLLKPLGIPQAVLTIQHSAAPPGPSGSDEVDLLFSANKGIAPRPLEAVASGGEFSRVMFCVKYVLAEKRALPTLVLDEIDTGVSGEIAIQLGAMMQRMAGRHQLIAISHLPQIAARGEEHFLVFKDTLNHKTSTEIRLLAKEERVEEIAKMIGGAKPSVVARENARELLGA